MRLGGAEGSIAAVVSRSFESCEPYTMLASSEARRHHRGIMSPLPSQFTGVTVVTKANVYFDGNVVSHTILLRNDEKKTLGLIRPGSYHFNTDAPERMEIIAGSCRVTLDGQTGVKEY